MDVSFSGSRKFDQNRLEKLHQLVECGTVGHRWYQVDLHTHGQGNDPEELVRVAREREVDLLAITDHQTFKYVQPVMDAAASDGRPLTVLPGIEITTKEGCHLLAVFPRDYAKESQQRFIAWLDIPGTGVTNVASEKSVEDVFERVETVERGIIIVPHPFDDKTGLLGSARKMNIRSSWLDSGYVRLIQISPSSFDDKIKYISHDDAGNWVNRYVLASANNQQIQESSYCLSPFNRSDAHRIEEIGVESSWFRMSETSVEGLRQVACEPRTRISCKPPQQVGHDCILCVRVEGGFSDGQEFHFNELLNCVVGPNHAGKSAVLDFLRFGLGHDLTLTDQDAAVAFYGRLHAILQDEGRVEVVVRQCGEYYVVERKFTPLLGTHRGRHVCTGCTEGLIAYRLDREHGELLRAEEFSFPIEVYEQGRIGELRKDVARQLEMLDEFADAAELKRERETLIKGLNASANALKPLYEERENLKSEVSRLPNLHSELAAKKELVPDADLQARWTKSFQCASGIEEVVSAVKATADLLPEPNGDSLGDDDLLALFGQSLPELPGEDVAEASTLDSWLTESQATLHQIELARQSIVAAAAELVNVDRKYRSVWSKKHQEFQRTIRESLAEKGIESPTELIQQIGLLQTEITTIEQKRQPRLVAVNLQISAHETKRDNDLACLAEVQHQISARRQEKAKELNQTLDDKIIVSIIEGGDREEYRAILRDICTEIASAHHRIQNRDEQLARVVEMVPPLELNRALRDGGVLRRQGIQATLVDVCGVTPNTQNVLCSIANDILLLNRLALAPIHDVPQIKVRREGETAYADLSTGLSPGEQSAAILTLALETRRRPLVIDQPEDELGHSYVVNLTIPKLLAAKFLRQVIVVTHDANIPVLGDSDYVIRMENRPVPAGRVCVVSVCGCFESPQITQAVVELDGGQRAFLFRQRRYSLALSADFPVSMPGVPTSPHFAVARFNNHATSKPKDPVAQT